MKKLTGYGLTLLMVVLMVGVLLDSGSVQRIESDVEGGQPGVTPTAFRALTAKLSSRLAVGERFTSQAELVADQQAAGFVKVGSFGGKWPAKVTEIATDRDEISFVRQNGTPHLYNKFDGYNMKMVRLMAGRNETILVFRSRNKR